MNIDILKGQTLKSITRNPDYDELIFETVNGDKYKMYHDQDCCESVLIDDIEGDFNDLIGFEILQAESPSSEDYNNAFLSKFTEINRFGSKTDKDGNYEPESHTWTFYKLATIKGYVTIRWYGESNGFYSESVEFVKCN